MTEEVHVRFDTAGVEDAAKKVRAALDQLKLVSELDPAEGTRGGVLVLIYKRSWDAKTQAKIRDALVAQGLPGTFAVEATSSHGFV